MLVVRLTMLRKTKPTAIRAAPTTTRNVQPPPVLGRLLARGAGRFFFAELPTELPPEPLVSDSSLAGSSLSDSSLPGGSVTGGSVTTGSSFTTGSRTGTSSKGGLQPLGRNWQCLGGLGSTTGSESPT